MDMNEEIVYVFIDDVRLPFGYCEVNNELNKTMVNYYALLQGKDINTFSPQDLMMPLYYFISEKGRLNHFNLRKISKREIYATRVIYLLFELGGKTIGYTDDIVKFNTYRARFSKAGRRVLHFCIVCKNKDIKVRYKDIGLTSSEKEVDLGQELDDEKIAKYLLLH